MSDNHPPQLTIRCGFVFEYEAAAPTTVTLLVDPAQGPAQQLLAQKWVVEPQIDLDPFIDGNGNQAHRMILPTGRTRILHDLLVGVPAEHESRHADREALAVEQLPASLLRYVLPSRYCDSDRLMDFAFQHFGLIAQGIPRVQAICNWLHVNIQYRWGTNTPLAAASEIIAQGFGVCRDFAHSAIALCRCFNIPARYVTGYLPDVAFQDSGAPMDFHAYFQAYLGGQWCTFDARFNRPRMGRINIATGLDAIDGAFATIYGAATCSWFEVWSYQIDPGEVQLGGPVDLGKRLDGTPALHLPQVAWASM